VGGAYAFLAYQSDRFITWERLAAGILAVAAVLALRSISRGAILWIVAALLCAALVLERRRLAGVAAAA
jgi:hypothetical protein